ncbi:hypothetical protein GGF46_002907, partial [Coemansia sp. RSA 552]
MKFSQTFMALAAFSSVIAGAPMKRNEVITADTPAPTDVPAPEIPAPEIPAPEVPAPEVPAPEVPAPEVPAPEVPAPEEPGYSAAPPPPESTPGEVESDYTSEE